MTGKQKYDDISGFIEGSGVIEGARIYRVLGSQLSELATKWKKSGERAAMERVFEKLDKSDAAFEEIIYQATEYYKLDPYDAACSGEEFNSVECIKQLKAHFQALKSELEGK